MAYIKLPLRADLPAYEYQITLEDKILFFDFNWNARIGKWFLTIKDENQAEIVKGIKLLASVDLFGRFKDTRLPLGTLYILDTANENKDPGIEDLGRRHIMLYRESFTID